jgi:phenylacetate-CoA ligase
MIFNPEMETLDRSELRRLQLERLGPALERAYARVPLVKRRFDECGLKPSAIRSVEDLADVPFTRKADLREHYPFGLFAEPLENVARLHASSGTKGKPTVVGYTRADIEMWAECVARCIGAAGAQPGDVIHVAYGYGLFTGGLGLHYGAERFGATVVPASGGNTPRQVMLLRDFGAVGLCCTPSYALNIADALAESGGLEGVRLRYGIFGAEPWSEELRDALDRRLALTATDIYGLSEVMGPGVSQECAEGRAGLHIWEDYFLPEIVDPETGDPLPEGRQGELVFTSLTKEAFPVVRYRTGDITTLRSDPCACGRTHTRMSRIVGRSDDMLIVRGVNVFPSEIESALLAIPELAPHYQILLGRERALDTLTVRVEVTEEWSAGVGDWDAEHPAVSELSGKVAESLQRTLGITTGALVEPPSSVPRSEGKAVRVVDQRTA